MSAFTTKHPCPVLSCRAYFFTNSFSKTPSNYQAELIVHLRSKHPFRFRLLRAQGRMIKLLKKARIL